MDNEQLKANITSGKQWIRLVFMLLFALALYFATLAMWVVVVLQFLFALFTGKDNAQLRSFGFSLSTYLFDVYRFLTYNSDEKPFPFADWPDSPKEVKEKVVSEVKDVVEAVKEKAEEVAEDAAEKVDDVKEQLTKNDDDKTGKSV